MGYILYFRNRVYTWEHYSSPESTSRSLDLQPKYHRVTAGKDVLF